MAAYETSDLYEIGNLLDSVKKHSISTPQDMSNKVRKYITKQEAEKNDVVEEN
jgi:hypothetical protein|tara:strand:- start:6385 stop:6543 length:159 start_codon:yes stop_codon:yes gene_type:complete